MNPAFRQSCAPHAFLALLALGAALASPRALADAAAGSTLAQSGAPGVVACATCHGANGEGQAQAGFPRLAGQVRAYLAKQLADFRSGARRNPVMEPIAKALSGKQAGDAADYFSSLPAAASKASVTDTPRGAGERVALRGDWAHGVPACFKCHGARGAGVAPHFPAIAGQGAAYTAKQLREWKSGARANDPQGLMKSVADHLPDSEIDAVAAWLASPATAPGPGEDEPAASLPPPGAGEPAKRPPGSVAPKAVAFRPPPEDRMPSGPFGDAVRLGRAIFTDTQHSATAYVGNGLDCQNCHLDAGRLAGSAPLWAAYTSFPAYRAKNGKVNSFEDRLAGCFRFSMNGKAPAYDSKEMVALVAYSYWLAQGAPTGAELQGRGYPKLDKPPQAPDAKRGADVFAANCAICHGADGQGTRAGDRYTFPPLWGPQSFNAGAGMHNVATAAAFIRRNMPLGKGESLSPQEAWDAAAFMDGHARPPDPRKVSAAAAPRGR